MVKEDIGVDMTFNVNNITSFIPMNDGRNLNLFTGEIKDRSITDRFTHSINAHIDPNIKSIIPDESSSEAHKYTWDFFYKICCEDVEFALFLILVIAISISGDVSDQTMTVLAGDANNG